jgi:hypothetical protein
MSMQPPAMAGGSRPHRCSPASSLAIVDHVTVNAHIIETGTQSYRVAAAGPPAQTRQPLAR